MQLGGIALWQCLERQVVNAGGAVWCLCVGRRMHAFLV